MKCKFLHLIIIAICLFSMMVPVRAFASQGGLNVTLIVPEKDKKDTQTSTSTSVSTSTSTSTSVSTSTSTSTSTSVSTSTSTSTSVSVSTSTSTSKEDKEPEPEYKDDNPVIEEKKITEDITPSTTTTTIASTSLTFSSIPAVGPAKQDNPGTSISFTPQSTVKEELEDDPVVISEEVVTPQPIEQTEDTEVETITSTSVSKTTYTSIKTDNPYANDITDYNDPYIFLTDTNTVTIDDEIIEEPLADKVARRFIYFTHKAEYRSLRDVDINAIHLVAHVFRIITIILLLLLLLIAILVYAKYKQEKAKARKEQMERENK